MALSQEDLDQLGQFVSNVVEAKMQEKNVVTAPEPVADDPDTAATKEAAPWYYVHLADGRVLESQDSAATHMEGAAVIGRYPKGE